MVYIDFQELSWYNKQKRILMDKFKLSLMVPVSVKKSFDVAVKDTVGESRTDLVVKFMNDYGKKEKEHSVYRGGENVMVLFEVPREIKDRFKKACKQNKKSMTEVLVGFMSAYGK